MEEMQLSMEDIQLIYEDADLLVCFKPAGLPVQTASLRGQDVESLLKNDLRDRFPEKGEPSLYVVHRLDQPVQGLLVFARTKAAAASLSAQAADNRMKKEYLALVRPDVQSRVRREGAGRDGGEPCGEGRYCLEDYLLRDGRTNLSRVVPAGTKGAKKAQLTYEDISSVEEESAGVRMLRIHLLTGRHHQIRVQLSHAGMPLVGDRKYGKPGGKASSEKAAAPDSGRKGDENSGLMLCACSLTFVHPRTGKECAWSIEEEVLRKWRGKAASV